MYNLTFNCISDSVLEKLSHFLLDFRNPLAVESVWIYSSIIIIAILTAVSLKSREHIVVFGKKINSTLPLFILYGCSVVLLNLPNFLQSHLHIDESQHIGEAITLFNDPRFWLSVDGTTIGPLPIYIAAIPGLFGIQLNFMSIRCMNELLWLITAFFIYRSFMIFNNRRESRILILPLIFIIALFNSPDLVSYNGESASVLFLTMAFYLILKIIKEANQVSLFILGIVLSLIPFTKIQAGPVAFLLGLFTFYYLMKSGIKKYLFIAGLLSPVCLLMIYLAKYQLIYDFWQSYILNNLFYTVGGEGLDAQRGFLISMIKTPLTIFSPVETRVFYLMGIMAGLYFLVEKIRQKKYEFANIHLAFLVYLFGSLIIIIIPGNIFYHYSLYLLSPMVLLAGLLSGKIFGKKFCNYPQVIFIALFCLLPSLNTIFSKSSHNRFILERFRESIHKHAVSRAICKLADNNDRIAMWGWETYVYPETGLPMGTREAHSQRQILSVHQQKYYLERYLSDLKKNTPRFFIDSVNPDHWLFNKQEQRHENYPAIDKYISENYTFVDRYDGARLYVLKN